MDVLSSSFFDLFRSGCLPSPAETLTINAQIKRHEDELSSVSVEIDQLQEKLRQLKENLRQLQEKPAQIEHSIFDYRSLFAPIRRLSPEILGEIFLHSLEYNEVSGIVHDFLTLSYSKGKAPWLLLRVCARWRDVALKTPRLWANLSMANSIPSDVRDSWLSRSGACSLDLRLEGNYSPLQFLTQPTASLDHATLFRRLRRLDITVDSLQGPLFPAHPVDMPSLESLEIKARRYFMHDNAISDGSILVTSAPRLRECSITGLSPRQISLPWSQLTRLRMQDHLNVVDTLRWCTNLVELEIHYYRVGPYVGNSSGTSIKPVFLPHLTTMALSMNKPISSFDPAASGLTCFTLPSLRRLKVEARHEDVLMLLAKHMLQQSGQKPETLELSCTYYSDLSTAPLEELLVFTPQLRHLILWGSVILPVQALSHPARGKESQLVPMLETLQTEHMRLEDLIVFIKARWHGAQPPPAALRAIYVPPWDEKHFEQLSFLKRCMDEGLDLRSHAQDTTTWPKFLSRRLARYEDSE